MSVLSSSYALTASFAANVPATASYALQALSSSFASTIANGLNITASNLLVSQNLIVNGTASISNLVTVTGSSVIIGNEFIVLNANPPVARYAGMLVYDTGSAATASLEWDGNNDNWIIVEETGQSALLLTGPTGSKGSEVAPTVNTLLKGTGHHTVGNSNVSDNGIQVSIATPLVVTGSITATSLVGTASFAVSASRAITAETSVTASHVVQAISASYALSASRAETAGTATTLVRGRVRRT